MQIICYTEGLSDFFFYYIVENEVISGQHAMSVAMMILEQH